MSAFAYALDPADDTPLGDVLSRLGAPDAEAVLVVARGDDARVLTPALLGRLSDALLRLAIDRREQAIDTLVALHLDGAGRPSIEQDLIDDNASLRARLLATIPMRTAAEVSRAAGAKGRNPSEPASRWKREGRVLAVPHGGVDLYPTAQFDLAGQPIPVLRQVLAALPPSLPAWPRLAWLASGNGWLGGRAPLDALGEPEALVEAARRLADPAPG